MRKASRLGLLLEIALLLANLATTGRVAQSLYAISVFVVALVGGLVAFCAVVLAVGVVGQRQPPYDMVGSDDA